MELFLQEIRFCQGFVGFRKTIKLNSLTIELSIIRRKCENLIAIICDDVKLIDDSKFQLLEIFKLESIVLLRPQQFTTSLLDFWIVNKEFLWFGKKILICELKEENVERELEDQYYRRCYITIYTQNNPTFEDVKQLLNQDERFQQISNYINKTLNGEEYVIGEFKAKTSEDYFQLDKCIIDYPIIFPVVYVCLYSQKSLEEAEPCLM
jgi:hypothetical protein